MIRLTLPPPISANRYWQTAARGGRAITYVSAEAKAYRKRVAGLCFAAGISKPITGRVAITVQLYPHRPLDFKNRQRKLGEAWDDSVQCIDLDNANKVLLDALKGVAIEDDKWVRRLTSERMEPDGEARVVVTITALSTECQQSNLLDAAA